MSTSSDEILKQLLAKQRAKYWVRWAQVIVQFVVCVVLMALIQGFCFWLPWTALGIGEKYFSDIVPSVWSHPGLWDCAVDHVLHRHNQNDRDAS